MLSNAQVKLIKSLHTKKGREKAGLCLVEGEKGIQLAGTAVEYTFTPNDTPEFTNLVTTETPQTIAAVARIPQWELADVITGHTIVVLDGVQDPGNVGSILRLCLGFNATVLLIESADVTNPKVVRSSVGAVFQVPWLVVPRSDAETVISALGRPIFRLEKTISAEPIRVLASPEPSILIAGSEGSGIQLTIGERSVMIQHHKMLESLNVTHALAIALYERMSAQ